MARLQRSANDDVTPQDFCYDYDADGILDGGSGAVLVNLDSIGMDKRFLTVVPEHSLGETEVYMPNILRTKAQANGDKDYCDILIGLPVLKSHLSTGLTGALKLHYGFRYRFPNEKEPGRWDHSGYNAAGNLDLHADYICAQHRVRGYDFVLMDAITGNRRGPHNLEFRTSSDYPTDYLLMNCLLASTDSVALDTVAYLLVGYRPETIPFTIDAAVNGLGICWTEWIRVSGLDSFTKHRQFLLKEYDPEKMKEKYKGKYLVVKDWDGQFTNNYQPRGNIGEFGSYPFPEWGPARNLTPPDFSPYKTVSLKLDSKKADACRFSYSVADDTYEEKDVARIELLINGNPETFIVKAAKSGEWDVDLSRYRGKKINCNLAFWDYNLNCTISEGITVSLP
jgi:hypothetical protein